MEELFTHITPERKIEIQRLAKNYITFLERANFALPLAAQKLQYYISLFEKTEQDFVDFALGLEFATRFGVNDKELLDETDHS